MIGFGPGWEGITTLVALIALAYVAAVWIGFVVWTHRDVQERTADPNERLAAVLVVAFFSAPGWLVYLLLRPSETLDELRIEQLQEQLFSRELAAVSSCSRCRRRVEEDFLVCPFCREALREPCGSCQRPVAMTWEACAYCGATQARRAPVTQERRAAAARAVPAAARAVPAAARPLMIPKEAR
jgi:double zinc ribbon protein